MKILYKFDKKKILFIFFAEYILNGLLINSVVGLNLLVNISSDKRFTILFVLGLFKFRPFWDGLKREISNKGFGSSHNSRFSIVGRI